MIFEYIFNIYFITWYYKNAKEILFRHVIAKNKTPAADVALSLHGLTWDPHPLFGHSGARVLLSAFLSGFPSL